MPELVCAADDPRWQAERRRGVTATDITAILGLSPYESAYSLYCRKTGDITDGHEDNDRLRLGRDLEPLIVDRWKEANGHLAAHGLPHLWRSSDRPWQMATPDRIVYDKPERIAQDWTGCLEVKSWADIDRDAWAGGIPSRVCAQVLWQMDTLDVARGHVGVLFLPSGEFRSYVIEHDESPVKEYPHDIPGPLASSICHACGDIELMRDAARDFLDRIDRRDPPPVDGSSATLAALWERFPAHKGKEAEIDPELWNAYEILKKFADDAEVLFRGCEAEVRVQLGEASILTVNGVKVATRVTGSSQVKAHTRTSDYIRRTPKRGEA